jgi:hypothetical protein
VASRVAQYADDETVVRFEYAPALGFRPVGAEIAGRRN